MGGWCAQGLRPPCLVPMSRRAESVSPVSRRLYGRADMARPDPTEELASLHRHAAQSKAAADKAVRAYDRNTWIRFTLVFFPVPFVLVLLRLQIEAWGYYVAGALFLASASGLYMLDGAAAARRDRAVKAADEAQKAYDDACTDKTTNPGG